MGGLARRATCIEQLIKENPNTVIVDSGNLSNHFGRVPLITSLYKDLGYHAVGLGSSDLRIKEELTKYAGETGLRLVDAAPDTADPIVPYVIQEVDGVKIGIVSFGGIALDKSQDEFKIRRAFYSAFKSARDESDILILLDQANMATNEWLERNGPRLGVPDLVIGGIGRAAVNQVQMVGKTHLMPTSMQGKEIGCADIEFTPGQPIKMAAKKISLDETYKPNEAIERRIAEVISKELLASGQEVSVYEPGKTTSDQQAASTSAPGVAEAAHDPNKYYAPLLCKGCHEVEYEDWQITPHAYAIRTLMDENRTIPECLQCHSEMFRRAQRVVMPKDGVGGIECATCHFGSLPHGADRKSASSGVKVDPKICLDCHTPDRSPNYDERLYMQMVSHKAQAPDAATKPGTAGAAAPGQ